MTFVRQAQVPLCLRNPSPFVRPLAAPSVPPFQARPSLAPLLPSLSPFRIMAGSASSRSRRPPSLESSWRALKRETGSLEPKRPERIGRKPELSQEDRDFLRQVVEERQSIVLRELRDELAEVRNKDISAETVRTTLKKIGIAHKRFGDTRPAKPQARPTPRESTKTWKAAEASQEEAPAPQEPKEYRYQEKDRVETEPVFYERQAYPSDLTDREWAFLEPLLLPRMRRGRPRKTPLREIVNAIRYIARTGCQWRSLPHDFPDWQTVAKTCEEGNPHGGICEGGDPAPEGVGPPRLGSRILSSVTHHANQMATPLLSRLRQVLQGNWSNIPRNVRRRHRPQEKLWEGHSTSG